MWILLMQIEIEYAHCKSSPLCAEASFLFILDLYGLHKREHIRQIHPRFMKERLPFRPTPRGQN